MKTLTKVLTATGLVFLGYQIAKSALRASRTFSYENKVAIVTGGSRGLGLVLARHLVDRGAKVAICARTAADLKVAAEDLRSRGGDVLEVICDVRKQDQVQELVSQTIKRWGRVDLLFNVAGIMQVGPLESMTIQDFRDAMEVNCWGPLHTTLAVVPVMQQQKWGRILNVGSIGGKRAVPHMIPYDTSKFALVGMSSGMRIELAKKGILVTTANPSVMRTGSPRNASFKGQHRLEYAWFSISDGLPLLSLDANSAAAQILQACQYGDSEAYITSLLSPAAWLASFPQLTTELLALANYLLPAMGGIGQRSAYGYQSESALSPSVITALGEAAARDNNEMRPR